MKALTLTAPYGTLIALGAKKIETRSWRTSYRGPLAIHQGSNLKPVSGKRGLWDLVWHPPFRDVLAEHAESRHMDDILASLPLGAIVAVCELAVVVPMETFTFEERWARLREGGMQVWNLTDQERAFGNYAAGRYAWLLADIRALPEPIKCKGAMGLWDWEGELGL